MAKPKAAQPQAGYYSSLQGHQPITAANYTERAVAFTKSRGGLVIVGPDHPHMTATPAPWAAWIAYFTRIGLPTKAMQAYKCCTVPTEWPEDFDPSCPVSDRDYRAPEPPKTAAKEDLAVLRRFVGGEEVF